MALGLASYYLALGGRQADAVTFLDRLEEMSRERHVPATARVWGYVGLGDYERALEWAEIGYQQRDSVLPHVRVLRAFKPLHPDPRFQDLMRRVGLPQPSL